MKKILSFLLLSFSLTASTLYEDIKADFSNYYSEKTLYTLAPGFTAGAIIANSSCDQNVQDFYQNSIRSARTDDFLSFWKKMGQDEAIIAYTVLGAFTLATKDTPTGDFSHKLLLNSGRAFLVGTIPLHITRTLTGGSRPSNTNRASYWVPFTLPHGVSGHTYTGAILFITWAKLVNNPYCKAALYGVSTLTGISRINDECHYPSQVLLGWLMAYVACDAVSTTNSNVYLTTGADRISFAFEF